MDDVYTQTDLERVNSAIDKLVDNKRVKGSDLGGKMRDFPDVTLRQLLEYKREIVAYLSSNSESVGCRRSLTRVASDTYSNTVASRWVS